ncbi:MAG TPA: alcohol dehydrogenase catalytic domain-containing protein [Nitrososphaeraceae archaeon]|jgi:L-iditol 2-dehydrogenase
MSAAVYYGPGSIINKKNYLSGIDDKERIILKLKACAVCGYDVRIFRSGHLKVTPPVILGHEICGEIRNDIASIVNGKEFCLKSGTRVAVSPIVPCLNCRYCDRSEYNLCLYLKEIGSSINGGFAEYIDIPPQLVKIGGLIPIPNSIDDDEAALLEPLACCLNCHINMGMRAYLKDTMAIIGDGPIGLLHLLLSKNAGMRTILVGKIPNRLDKAYSLGADLALLFNNEDGVDGKYDEDTLRRVLNYTDGYGADYVIIATSSPRAIEFALKIAAKNAKINIFAGMLGLHSANLDLNWLHYNQATITGSFSSTPNMLNKAVDLVSSGQIKLSEIISHHYPLADIKYALQATENFLGLRVIINKF